MDAAFLHFLRSRRSIRRFTNQPAPDGVLREILETAIHAPSAHGLQPWRFVAVKSQQARDALGQALTRQMREDMQAGNSPENEIQGRVERSLRRIAEAPHIFIVCRDSQAVRIPHDPHEDWMGIQSVAMAGGQLLLAAHARGLGGNWICWPLYAQKAVGAALSLPENWQPQGMVFLGYPAEQPKEKTLKGLNEILLDV